MDGTEEEEVESGPAVVMVELRSGDEVVVAVIDTRTPWVAGWD